MTEEQKKQPTPPADDPAAAALVLQQEQLEVLELVLQRLGMIAASVASLVAGIEELAKALGPGQSASFHDAAAEAYRSAMRAIEVMSKKEDE